MLRITVSENASEQRWNLQGRLVKCSVAELISAWRASRDQFPNQVRIVDLNEITSIDKDGEQVLRMMIDDGASLIANGLYTKHLLDEMRTHPAIPGDP